jgi:hypothetical protein
MEEDQVIEVLETSLTTYSERTKIDLFVQFGFRILATGQEAVLDVAVFIPLVYQRV